MEVFVEEICSHCGGSEVREFVIGRPNKMDQHGFSAAQPFLRLSALDCQELLVS